MKDKISSVKTNNWIKKRLLLVTLAVLLVTIAAAGGWLYGELKASLPQLTGTATLPGLAASVTVARDGLGVPTVRAENRVDAARALGYVHAQDRFFQMDLLRRLAAGELAALVGAGALEVDRAKRLHRFRSRAEARVAELPAADRALLTAYSAGVNAGLTALAAVPFEYLALRAEPQPWQAADSLLVIYAMYFDLQDETGALDAARGLLHATLPAALYAFLTPDGTEWDAPLQGEPLPSPLVPGADVVDVRGQAPLGSPWSAGEAGTGWEAVIGSNNWAVAGSVSAHGGAVLAGDMHLRIGVPNIWYRASLVYPAADGTERRVTGVTLPGAPAVVAGSNGAVAWAFTNSYGDWSDLVIIEPVGADAYLTPDGPELFVQHQEIIEIKDAEPVTLDILETRWGPLLESADPAPPQAIRWVAHAPQAVNLDLLRLESATTVAEALALANRLGIPAQNIVAADRDGAIGWSIAGPIPRRFGHDGSLPVSWADGSRGWDGWVNPDEYPRIINPPDGRLWTANARTVDGPALAQLGNGGYALGARARQIRDGLNALEKPDEAALLALQLDDRALFLSRWRELLLTVLTPQALAARPERAELRRQVEHWDARAAVDSVGYRLVRAFRLFVAERALPPLLAPVRERVADFDYRSRFQQHEGPLWQLVAQRPPYLLSADFADWDALLLAAADEVLNYFDGDLADHPWGEYNISQFQHPLSRAVPLLGYWLDFPAQPLPGDLDMPRVQSPVAGASQRLVVSPGREAQGIFHMPGGQSGHPLSPHYRDGHAAWVEGKPTPFLPGPTVHTLILVP